MELIFILAIVFGGTVLALAIIGSTILIGIRIIKGGISRKNLESQKGEAVLIQEIHQGLSGLEKRVDVLETIILDERKERKP